MWQGCKYCIHLFRSVDWNNKAERWQRIGWKLQSLFSRNRFVSEGYQHARSSRRIEWSISHSLSVDWAHASWFSEHTSRRTLVSVIFKLKNSLKRSILFFLKKRGTKLLHSTWLMRSLHLMWLTDIWCGWLIAHIYVWKNNDFLRRKNNDELANYLNLLMVCMCLIQFLLVIFRVWLPSARQ